VEPARTLLASGLDVFLEKPIAHELAAARELTDFAAHQQRILYVGYNLRFHPGLQKVKQLLAQLKFGQPLSFRIEYGQYLPDWRPLQDYRSGYNTRSAEGGGILLDGSHELDYLLWLAGDVETVYCEAAHLSRLEMDAEDTAAITLRTREGAFAEMHLDCVQRGYSRSCKVICERGTILWDFKQGVTCIGADEPAHRIQGTALQDTNQMYIDEMSHFIACLKGDASPLVTGADATRALEIALAARASAVTGERKSV